MTAGSIRRAQRGRYQKAPTAHASQQNVSKHLGILHAAGMASRTKQGNQARYAISDQSVFQLCDQVCGGVRRQLQELEAILQPT